METSQYTVDPGDSPTFEKVWKLFQESREQAQEMDRRFREELQEMSRIAQEEDRKLREKIAATDRQMKETDKKVGELTNRFGSVVEHMIVPNLLIKFKALGFTFEVASRNVKIADEKNNIFAEVDVFLENGDKAMIVEIKSSPSVEDLADHIERIEKLRRRADIRGDTRKYLGAVAGVVVSDSVKNNALGKGLYVIVPSGDTFTIIKPEGKYRAREW
jgi:hypothetical protein